MYPEGSLGADLSAALKGKKEQADLLEQIKTESAKAGGSGGSDGATGADDKRSNTPGEPTEQPSKQPPPPPPAPKPEIGELSCKVCMRAVDNIYADVNALARNKKPLRAPPRASAVRRPSKKCRCISLGHSACTTHNENGEDLTVPPGVELAHHPSLTDQRGTVRLAPGAAITSAVALIVEKQIQKLVPPVP